MSKRIKDTLARLASAETQFFTNPFLAPVARGGRVQVRIAGVVCTLAVTPAHFRGWGIFQPTSHASARLVREARLRERQQYLDLCPRTSFVIARRDRGDWLGIAAHQADDRFRIQGLVPIQLVEDTQLFDVVRACFDGAQFWFAGHDPRHDPAAARHLRQELEQVRPPEAIHWPGLSAEERAAYALNYVATLEANRDHVRDRIALALRRAGAELKDYLDREDGYTVTYSVDGQQYVSVVAKEDLTVQSAGICLSGQDERFDLQSLVGVLRESHER